jgi:glycosyltransferase involved in cell wall biosynthesis
MKIAQIDVNYGSSSTGKIVADLHVGLEDFGHSVKAFYGRGPASKADTVKKVSNDIEVGLHALGTRLTGFTGCYSPIATKKLINLLSLYKPGIVHLHDLHGYFIDINTVVNFLKMENIPTVWTFHSEFMYTGKCGHALDCDKWRTHCDECPSLDDYPKSYIDRTAKMFDSKYKMFEDFENIHIVSPSDWLARRIRASVIAGSKDITVIPNGLDVNVFYPRDTDDLRKHLDLDNKFTVLSVGSNIWSDMKGGKWVLKLAKRMPQVSFVMVGVDSQPDFAPGNVKMIAPVRDQNLLAEYYSLADVLLLTSIKETFSMVTAESLACGTPVVGFDSGAPKEVAPQGYGTFVPQGDIDGLELSVWECKNKLGDHRSAFECREFAKKMYSKEVMVRKYEHIYQKLVASI